MKNVTSSTPCSLISCRAVFIVIVFCSGFLSCSRISDNRELSTRAENQLLSSLPLRFVKNIGQTLPEVLYHVEGAGHTVLFESGRVVFNKKERGANLYSDTQIVLEFPGSNISAKIRGLDKQSGVTNYYNGNDPSEWHTEISSYEGLKYEGLYTGIDMICSGDKGTLKNEFLLAPGAEPDLIRMVYTGAKRVKVSRNGELRIHTDDGMLVDAAPVAYQMINGERNDVGVKYSLRDGAVGFKLKKYNPELPLIIDPEFSYITYYSGNDVTTGTGVAVDGDGYLLFAGYSLATDLPVANAVQDTHAGWEDAFVVKVDTSTGDYIYATYMGGDTSDIARDFVIDDEGNAYITGSTISPNFPVSADAFQKTFNGYQEAFLAKLGPDGTLIFSTLLGGSSRDYAYGMVLNERKEVHLTGYTLSSDFPSVEALQAERGGSYDAFVSRISAGGDSLLYSTFFGGSGWDGARSIALDEHGFIYITGETESTDFPLANAAQGTIGGLSDAFVAKINPSDQEVVYSTYLGGAEDDLGYDIVVDTTGIAYVCGATASADFPEKSLGQAKSLKSASEVPETGVDAFYILYDVLGQMVFGQVWRLPGFNYYRTMRLMSYGFDPILILTGYVHSGLSVKAYAIRDYSEIIEVYEAQTVYELDDVEHHYYPFDISALVESGIFVIPLTSNATIPTPENATSDPNPDDDNYMDYLIMMTKPAEIEVSIAMPDSIQYQATLVTYIQVKNISPDVEAKMVQLTIGVDTSMLLTFLEKYDDPFLNEPFMLGNIPPGDSVEIIAGFKAGSEFDFYLVEFRGGSTFIEIDAEAKGANTNLARAARDAKAFELHTSIAVELFSAFTPKKSAQIEMVDLYLNDELFVDDLQTGKLKHYDISIAGIYPNIDITSSTAADNSDPIASYVIDLNGPGNEHLISPRNHHLILVEDLEDMIKLYHKRDVRAESSDPSQVDLFVVHGAGDIGNADIRIVDINNHETVLGTLLDDLEPDSVTGYISLTPGIVAFELGSSDNSKVHEVVEADLSTLAGKAIAGVIVPVAVTEGASATLAISQVVSPVGISHELLRPGNGVGNLNLYPNPFGISVNIEYYLEQAMDLEISVYNSAGQKIRNLYSGFQTDGEHQIYWEGTNEIGQFIDPGIYFCVLRTKSGISTHKLTKAW